MKSEEMKLGIIGQGKIGGDLAVQAFKKASPLLARPGTRSRI